MDCNENKQSVSSVSASQYSYPTTFNHLQDDEINLLDIWRILVKRKKMIITISLLITLLSSTYAVLRPEIYSYSTAIQIGSLFAGNSEKPVDTVKNAASKLKELYINSVLNDFYRTNPEQAKNIKINVSIPKDSEILVIGSKCSEKQAPLYIQLINKISTKLIDNHSDTIKKTRTVLLEQLEGSKNRLALLADNEKELSKRIEGFDKAFKASPINNSGTTALVMTELSQQQHQISSEKFSLLSQIASNESEFNLIQDTKLLYPVEKSIEPVGIDTKLIIIASILAGLILGIFTALMWDFIEKTKTQLASETTS